jgi:hypothetical protein
MAYTTIDNGEEHFSAVTYTGTGSSRSITGLEFGPDWVWIKRRNGAYSHYLYDSTRGTGKQLYAEKTDAEATDNTEVTAFNSDGFSLGSGSGTNENTNTQVAWCWKANGGTTSTNNDGSTASTVQANTTAGFSIVTFSRSAGGTITVGHGLGKKPDWIIVKSRQTSNNWVVTHKSLGTEMQDYYMILNGTDASSNSNDIFGGEPTSSVFSTTNNVASNDNQIAYCFTEIQGYSKFGSYTGNGNADGTFVYTGFKPAWLMVKKSVGNARAWVIHDNKRDIDNPTASRLDANLADAEQSSGHFDFLSNGFKCRSTEGATNQNTHTFVYMAFAEHPFVSSKGVPVTAR